LNELAVLKQVFKRFNVDQVIDVGANTGQYGSLLRESGYAGPLLSIEPLKDAHQVLVEAAAADPLWHVSDPVALGSCSKTLSINVAGNSASSSFLPMRQEHLDAAPYSAYTGAETVTVMPLDKLVSDRGMKFVAGMLKIDTQGFELEVLSGAIETLKRCILVQCEISLVPLYDGQPAPFDLCSVLHREGFELRYFIPGFRDPSTREVFQFDGIFARKN